MMSAQAAAAHSAHSAARPTATPTKGQHHGLTHLGAMVRFTLRYNWLRLFIWFLLTVGMVAFVAIYYTYLSQHSADFASQFEGLLANPSMLAMLGSVTTVGNADAPLGALVWMKIWMFTALMLSIGMLFLVTHNLRADEDSGRIELFRSRPLGLHSRLGATVIVTAVFSLVIGILIALVSMGLQLNLGTHGTDYGMAGSWVFGLSITMAGWLGIGIAALFNELAPSSGTANTLGTALIAVFYLIRMVAELFSSANGSPSAALWISPLGWAEKMDPWGNNLVWPLFAMLVLFAVFVLVAWIIEDKRDYDGSLIPARLGKAQAGNLMTRVWGLSVRLHRTSFISWAIGVAIFAAVFGSIVQQFASMVADLGLQGLSTAGVNPEYLIIGMLACFISLAICAFTIQSAGMMSLDDSRGLLEAQLAGGVSRLGWILQRLLVTVIGTVLLLLIGGLFFGVSCAASLHDWSYLPLVLGAVFVHFPSMLALLGVVVFCFGWLPRLAIPLGWVFEGATWFALIVLMTLNIPQSVIRFLPFLNLSTVPATTLTWQTGAGAHMLSWWRFFFMLGVALVLIIVGLIGFRRRNVPSN